MGEREEHKLDRKWAWRAALRAAERGHDPEIQAPLAPEVFVFPDRGLAPWPAEGRPARQCLNSPQIQLAPFLPSSCWILWVAVVRTRTTPLRAAAPREETWEASDAWSPARTRTRAV